SRDWSSDVCSSDLSADLPRREVLAGEGLLMALDLEGRGVGRAQCLLGPPRGAEHLGDAGGGGRALAGGLEDLGRDGAIEVIATQGGVTAGGLHLEHPVDQLEDGDVEGAAAQVVDREVSLASLVEAVGQGRGGRLVDEAQDL